MLDYVKWNQGSYRFQNVVYLRTNKCAGTYFSNLFLQNGWKEIRDYDITEDDLLIGFILHPKARRIKALAQRLITNSATHLLKDTNFCNFISDNIINDDHNIPYFIQFRNRKNLTLIPLDYSTRAEVLLQSFFKIHNVPIDLKLYNSQGIESNSAHLHKITIYNELKRVLNDSLFYRLFLRDYQLHSRIVESLDRDAELYLQGGQGRAPWFTTDNVLGDIV